MKKNIFNDDQTFIEWAQNIDPAKHIPKRIHHKIYKDMEARLHPKSSHTKLSYKYFKMAVAAALILLFCGTAITIVDAGAHSAVFGIFKNAEDIQYLNEQPPIVNSDTSTDAQNDISNIHSCIVDASSFNDNIFFSTVNDVIVKENSGTAKIPELTFGSMDMIVIAQDNYVGWELAEGEQLQIKISIDPYYAHADGTGENMGFGYVYDNKYHELEFQNATEFNFTITADKSGHYYPVLQNIGVSYIHITSGSVSIK